MTTVTGASGIIEVDDFIYVEDGSIYDNSNAMFYAYVDLKKAEFTVALDDLQALNESLTKANEYYGKFVEFASEDSDIRLKNEMTYEEFFEMISWMDKEFVDYGDYITFSSHWTINETYYSDDKGGTENTYLSKSEVQGFKALLDTYIKSLEADQSKQSIEVNQHLTRMNEGLGWWGGKLDSFDRLWSKITGNI